MPLVLDAKVFSKKSHQTTNLTRSSFLFADFLVKSSCKLSLGSKSPSKDSLSGGSGGSPLGRSSGLTIDTSGSGNSPVSGSSCTTENKRLSLSKTAQNTLTLRALSRLDSLFGGHTLMERLLNE